MSIGRTHFVWMESVIMFAKNIFLATLGVSESFVHNALRNQQGGVYLGTDKRDKHEPHNKTTKNAMELVQKHL